MLPAGAAWTPQIDEITADLGIYNKPKHEWSATMMNATTTLSVWLLRTVQQVLLAAQHAAVEGRCRALGACERQPLKPNMATDRVITHDP